MDSPLPVVLEKPEMPWEEATSQLQRGLDMEEGPLFRAAQIGGRLVFVAHHLIFDVVSWRVFLEDVLADYLTGKPAGRGFFIAAWAHHLCHTIEQGDSNHEIGYWTEAAAQVRKAVGMRERPTSGSGWRRRVFTASLDAAQTAALEAAQQTHDFRIPEVLLAALSLAWNEVFREASLPVSMEGHGRERTGSIPETRRWTYRVPSVGSPVSFRLFSRYRVSAPVEALEGVRHQLRGIPRRAWVSGCSAGCMTIGQFGNDSRSTRSRWWASIISDLLKQRCRRSATAQPAGIARKFG